MSEPAPILIVKTAALGDVLRTNAIVPGLVERHAPCRITWLTAPAAVDLVRTHPDVAEIVTIDVRTPASVAAASERLARTRWERVISLDDEEVLCRVVSTLTTRALSGATLDASGQRTYTPDVAAWFDMGLLSHFGKAEADRRKVANTRSQPAIYAEMLGIRMGKPRLVLDAPARAFAERFVARLASAPRAPRPLVGLNTGAGGRWASKQLSVERTVEFARSLAGALRGEVTFLVLGGDAEDARNAAIASGLAAATAGGKPLAFFDGGTRNSLLEFAGLVGACDLLLSSDSLALHLAIAQDVPVVAFFAPTSAAEIELYGAGEKVVSTAPDYCSYRPDADNRSITPERLVAAALRQLGPRVARSAT